MLQEREGGNGRAARVTAQGGGCDAVGEGMCSSGDGDGSCSGVEGAWVVIGGGD